MGGVARQDELWTTRTMSGTTTRRVGSAWCSGIAQPCVLRLSFARLASVFAARHRNAWRGVWNPHARHLSWACFLLLECSADSVGTRVWRVFAVVAVRRQNGGR